MAHTARPTRIGLRVAQLAALRHRRLCCLETWLSARDCLGILKGLHLVLNHGQFSHKQKMLGVSIARSVLLILGKLLT